MKRFGRERPGQTALNATREEDRRIAALDDLAEFQEYRENVLQQIREDISRGLDEKELVAKYKKLLVARQISIGLTDKDASKALSAIRDIRDREEGTAKQRIETTHRLEKLEDTQLDSLLLSEMRSVEGEPDASDEMPN